MAVAVDKLIDQTKLVTDKLRVLYEADIIVREKRITLEVLKKEIEDADKNNAPIRDAALAAIADLRVLLDEIEVEQSPSDGTEDVGTIINDLDS